MKNKQNTITRVIFSVIFLFTLILLKILIPFNSKGIKIFLIYLVLVCILYKFWIITTYGFVCRNCGYEFKIGIIKRCFSLKNKKVCPVCNSKNLIKEGIRNYYFEKWVDIDED